MSEIEKFLSLDVTSIFLRKEPLYFRTQFSTSQSEKVPHPQFCQNEKNLGEEIEDKPP